VKAALVADHGIDAARITTKGFGDTKPSAPNATAVGRAQNRRVEIVKQ
jgi:OmpA-OmpF porin, OOP family